MSIRHETITVTTTGSAGAATGNAQALIHGKIHSIHLNFHAGAPATTDTTVSFADTGGNILVVGNSATDAMFHPRAKAVDNANAAITDSHSLFVSNQAIKVALAECDALTGAVVATIYYEQ